MVVVGVGLVGGSLALAARRRGLVKEIVGYGRGEKNLKWAQKNGIIDRFFMREHQIPEGVDLLVMATPVQAINALTRSFLPKLEASCLITDVGSVKARVVRDMENLLPPGISFVGAHPIAGGEQWGAQAAVEELFVGQRCILTPTLKTDAEALKKVAILWRRVGAKLEFMDPVTHDEILGMVSHLPHVLAYAMVNTLSRWKVDSLDVKGYCGSGFKDFTRIASSRPEIWRDICLFNRQVISKSLGDYIKRLQQLRRWIRDGEGDLLEREFASANEIRKQIGSVDGKRGE